MSKLFNFGSRYLFLFFVSLVSLVGKLYIMYFLTVLWFYNITMFTVQSCLIITLTKNGDKTQVKNYNKLISITSIIPKMFGSIVYKNEYN